jgi:hypothetical protein
MMGARARATWLVPIGVLAAIAVVSATNPPDPASLPGPLAGALTSLEGWFDTQDRLGSPCAPVATAPAVIEGIEIDVPACWTLSTSGELADPGLAVQATVDVARYGDPDFHESISACGAMPDATLGGRLMRCSLRPVAGDVDPREIFVFFLSDSLALGIRSTVKNEFALSPKVAAHHERLGEIARSARPAR